MSVCPTPQQRAGNSTKPAGQRTGGVRSSSASCTTIAIAAAAANAEATRTVSQDGRAGLFKDAACSPSAARGCRFVRAWRLFPAQQSFQSRLVNHARAGLFGRGELGGADLVARDQEARANLDLVVHG